MGRDVLPASLRVFLECCCVSDEGLCVPAGILWRMYWQLGGITDRGEFMLLLMRSGLFAIRYHRGRPIVYGIAPDFERWEKRKEARRTKKG